MVVFNPPPAQRFGNQRPALPMPYRGASKETVKKAKSSPFKTGLRVALFSLMSLFGTAAMAQDKPSVAPPPVAKQAAQPAANEKQAEPTKSTLPETITTGMYLAKVDDVLELKRQDRLEYVVYESRLAEYSFKLKSGEFVKLQKPQNDENNQRLIEGLQKIGDKPMFITNDRTSKIETYALTLVPVMITTLLLLYFLRKSGMFNMDKVGYTKETPDTKFTDVRGYPDVVNDLRKLVKNIKDRGKNKVGAELPKGILLVGPPGTGKTHLARAVAGEAGVPFLSLSGSEFVEMFAGRAAAKIRRLFNDAKALSNPRWYQISAFIKKHLNNKQPTGAIIFIDEIDAIGGKRGGGHEDGGTQEKNQGLNQLLVEMDGFTKETGITVIAATNRPDILDPALKRRFPLTVTIPIPGSDAARKDILDLYLGAKTREGKVEGTVDIDLLSQMTEGYSGDDLSNLVKEAARLAFYEEKEKISMDHLIEAVTRVRLGRPQLQLLNEREHNKVVIHETAGHGYIARKGLKKKLAKVSTIARSYSGGHVMVQPNQFSRYLPSYNENLEMLLYILGGRAAEKVLLPSGEYTEGAKQDLDEARKIVRRMISVGMFDGRYAQNYEAEPDKNLSKEDETILNEVVSTAEKMCIRMIEKAPRQTLLNLVTKAIEAGELNAEKANDLFDSAFGPDFSLDAEYAQFLQDPRGSGKLTPPPVVVQEAPKAVEAPLNSDKPA